MYIIMSVIQVVQTLFISVREIVRRTISWIMDGKWLPQCLLFGKDSKPMIQAEDVRWLVETLEEVAENLPEEKRSPIKRRLDDIKTKLHGSKDGTDKVKQKARAAKVICVQLHMPKHTRICTDVLKIIQGRLKEHGIELKIQSYPNRNPSIPLIAMCLGKSRIGADVDDVIAPLIAEGNTDKNAWVIIIHDLKEHALPLGRTSTVLLDQKYSALAGYIDVAYQADQGLYQCEMNDTAVAMIDSILH